MTPYIGMPVQFVVGDSVRAALVTKVLGGGVCNLVVFGADVDERAMRPENSVPGSESDPDARYWRGANLPAVIVPPADLGPPEAPAAEDEPKHHRKGRK